MNTGRDPKRSWVALTPYLPARSKARLLGLGLANFVGGLAESLVLVIVTLTADSLIRDQVDISLLGVEVSRSTAVTAALLLVAARAALTLVAASVAARFSSQVMERAQHSLLDAYLGASHAVRSSRPPGDLGTVILTHGIFTGNLALSATNLAAGLCGLLAFGGTSLIVNPLATLAIAGIGALLLLALKPIRHRSRDAATAFTQMQRELGQEISQVESLHREIEVFRVGATVLERGSRSLSEGAHHYQRVRFLGAVVPQIFQASVLAAAVLSLLLVVNSDGTTDLAAIGAVVLLLVRSMSYAQQVVLANQQMIENGAYARGLKDLETSLNEETPTYGTARPESLLPLHLDGVHFSYDGEQAVLADVNTAFHPGELVGIVGPSGAGKSTLVELLLRLRLPTSGSINCGDTSIDTIDPAEFATRVAFVPQQPVLINGTVSDNVRFFRDIPEERVREALRQAHLETEIAALPDGMHTLLGPDERALSGGQRQRLTIARALAGDPEILVLDEPTSALDAVSEVAIREALDELPTGRVVLVVAHRYSTLRSCGRILVLRGGRVEVDGTPDEVASASAFFRSMVNETV